MIEIQFSLGQEVVITHADDPHDAFHAVVRGYSYYPNESMSGSIVLYELDVTVGYRRWLWRNIPVIQPRGMVGQWLKAVQS